MLSVNQALLLTAGQAVCQIHNKLTLPHLYINRWSEGFTIAACVPFAFTLLPLSAYTKGAFTRDDSQRPFLAQHSTAMLEECWNHWNNVGTMLQRCVALKIVLANRLV